MLPCLHRRSHHNDEGDVSHRTYMHAYTYEEIYVVGSLGCGTKQRKKRCINIRCAGGGICPSDVRRCALHQHCLPACLPACLLPSTYIACSPKDTMTIFSTDRANVTWNRTCSLYEKENLWSKWCGYTMPQSRFLSGLLAGWLAG